MLHCDVAPTVTVAGSQTAETDEILDGDNWTTRAAVADFDVSSILVAVTVTVVAELGAVNKPAEVIVPPVVDHITAEL